MRKMNLQQPTTNIRACMYVTEGVAGPTNAHQFSTPEDRSSRAVALRGTSTENRTAATSSNNFLATSTCMVRAAPGLIPPEKIQADSSIREPSLGRKEEMASFPSAPIETPAATSGNGAFSLAPSIVSKASTLSSAQVAFHPEPTETMRPDDINNSSVNELKHEEGHSSSSSSSSSSSTDEIDDDADESLPVPAYITCITASLQSTETIFTAREKELHFLSGIFRREYQSWLLDDEFDSDSDDDDDNHHHQDNYTRMHQRCFIEYTGRTNFVQRNGAYRKSHEIGPLSFAKTLDLDGVV